jgi:hypothetical protein
MADGRASPELILAGAPVYGSSPWLHGKDEELARVQSRASPEVEGQRGGRATVVQKRRWRRSVEAMLERREKRREAGRGVVKPGGGGHLLQGSGERRGGVAGVNAGVNGFNAIEDGGV